MTIDDCELEGPAPFHNLNSRWVRRQVECHPEYAELTEDNHQMLYIPKGLAHGFQTLADDSIVYYQMGQFYTPGAGSGIRYDDVRYGIRWPVEQKIMSEQDRSWGRAER